MGHAFMTIDFLRVLQSEDVKCPKGQEEDQCVCVYIYIYTYIADNKGLTADTSLWEVREE
jgi:hypothetical protein